MIDQFQIVIFVLVLARVTAFITYFSLFSRRQLPNLVKAGIAGALSVFWISTFEATVDREVVLNLGIVTGVLMISKEVFIGVMLSMLLNLFFYPAQVAGAYVGQELGLSLASINDPSAQDSSTLVAGIFEAFAILIFFSINLHHFVVLVIHHSFAYLHGGVDIFKMPTEPIVTMLNRVNDYGFLEVAPIVVLMMLVTLGLAFLTKAAPSLNLFSVGMPIRSWFGVLCLWMFCPVIFGAIQVYLFRIQEDIEHFLSLF